jgi:hypothetical protein
MPPSPLAWEAAVSFWAASADFAVLKFCCLLHMLRALLYDFTVQAFQPAQEPDPQM